jgi:Zn-dependent M28 family amino/carboxypeptidase
MNKWMRIALAGSLLVACKGKEKATATDIALSEDTLAKHIIALSDDALQGRKPFTEGETRTLEYLTNAFKALGTEPGNGNSYLQDVPMVNIATTAAPVMNLQSAKGNYTLKGFDDYVIWTEKTDSQINISNSELVFAGYGVVAPEYGRNDYAGLNVKGKTVLVLVNDPGFYTGDKSLFKGDTMTYYGRWTYKFAEAARQGATGCLIIHDTKAASYPFSVVQNNWNGSRLRLDTRGKEQPFCDMIGWVSADAAKKILAAAGKDTTLLAAADKKDFTAVPLNQKLSTTIGVKATYSLSHNVIAKITGSKYPNETIIYSAHWDHLGFGKPDATGDSIYNGALDNASGTAALLELARAFKRAPTAPERTVVFLSVTAEEQGLWGSAYYAANPVYPLATTVANINMDGINFYGKTKDLIVVGKGQSDLEDLLKNAAEKEGRYIAFEEHPEAGYYYRSDHFNFAKVGVPALYIENGLDVAGKGKEYGKKLTEAYTEKNYHRPSDEYDATTWKLDGAIADLKLLYLVGSQLAAGHDWPGWKEGSEFKLMREKMAAERK